MKILELVKEFELFQQIAEFVDLVFTEDTRTNLLNIINFFAFLEWECLGVNT